LKMSVLLVMDYEWVGKYRKVSRSLREIAQYGPAVPTQSWLLIGKSPCREVREILRRRLSGAEE
jgi:hypothetical protein